jgi:hypothetical protein
MKPIAPKRQRCAIYTRKSTEHNLDLTFTSLDAQREACEAYIKSQAHEGWVLVRDRFDDGGLSGAPWIALPFNACLTRSARVGSISSWCTRLIA